MLNLADSSSSEETFAYDAAGNLIGDHESNVYEYDSDNRLYSYNYCPVSCDADGNTTYAYLDSKTNHFEYDSANRLIKAGAYAYTYNAEDVRIRSTNGTNTTSYVYDTNARLSRLLVKNTDGNATKYVYGLGLIGEIRTGPFKTYHFDYRGSTVAVTSECGTEMATFAYDTYGKLLSRTGRFKPIFLYNGRDGVVTDPNGLLYMRARYYSPVLRRFMNADLLAGNISDARTLNRYAYVCGDPVSYVDPFGLEAERGICKTIANFIEYVFLPFLNAKDGAELIIRGVKFVKDGKYVRVIGDHLTLQRFGIKKSHMRIDSIKAFGDLSSSVSFKGSLLKEFASDLWFLDAIAILLEAHAEASKYTDSNDKAIIWGYEVTSGIVSSAAATAASAVTTTLVTKGFMMLGTAICPGFGTFVGIGVGLLVGWATETYLDKQFGEQIIEMTERN